jgi:ubiquinone/menaquinone biosynthesis C-methylase UbiE
MPLKSLIKAAFFGPPGMRPRKLHAGLLRGFRLPVDTAGMSMHLVGLWETEIAGVVRRAAHRASVACDVGANSGWYSLYFASRPNIERVYAFEPDPAWISVLEENVRLNDPRYLERVTIVEKLVGDRDDGQWCRLDTVLRDVGGPIVFKIDVDGGELDVLKGAREILITKPCELVIETHSPALERGCAAFLRSLGYRVRIIKNGWYRALVPETRPIELNRWMSATREKITATGESAESIQSRYYTRTAAHYDAMHVADDDEHTAALHHISAFITSMDIQSVLDVGCGTGRGLEYIRTRHPQVAVSGVEPVAALVDQAVVRHGIPRQSIVNGRGESLPFESESFDAVCEFGMLHHVGDPAAVVSEMLRVARRAIFISDANRFGQGSMAARGLKLVLAKCGLWRLANYVKTRGRGYTITDGDGLAYSYSVYDSFSQVARWADRVIMIPTAPHVSTTWLNPLLTSPTILMCAFKKSRFPASDRTT